MTTDELVSRHKDAWQAATVHPFLAGARDGSLPADCYETSKQSGGCANAKHK
jgi:thiaminase